MTDKRYCMSSYLAFRYIEDDDKDFFDGMRHRNLKPVPEKDRIPVYTAEDIHKELDRQSAFLKSKKAGVLLSGGMDSAIAASYMHGSDAYTFRFLGGGFQKEELERAEYYAHCYGLTLHYVDIDWNTVVKYTDAVMEAKAAPVHSIEPQILQAAIQAKNDGVELMVIGESADLVFYGMDQLVGKDWKFDEFVEKYTFLNPSEVLKEPADVNYLYERYRTGEDSIDYIRFINDVFAVESAGSYVNAFHVAQLSCSDPYANLVMAVPADLQRIRNGESKYLIRELMKMRYPQIPVPDKNPMPRPVDIYFENWNGPGRPEFRKDIDMDRFSGNQKWQMWCLERFLDLYD